jgi:hypothetical protein
MSQAALLVLLSFAAASARAADAPPALRVADGPLLGEWVVSEGEGATASAARFLGVPFAAPPTGELRWAPPAPPARWDAPLNATRWAPGCAQTAPQDKPSPDTPAYTSEDCLYLNVFAPPAAFLPGAALPILLWLHGCAPTVCAAPRRAL